MFNFKKFQECERSIELTDKQFSQLRVKLIVKLLTYNNNPSLKLDYFLKNLKIDKNSVRFSINDNPSRPVVFIYVNFMLESTLIESCATVVFNSSYCMIPYTYRNFDIDIKNTGSSKLYSVLNIYRPKPGVSSFYLCQSDDKLIYTVVLRDVFKFSKNFSPNRNRFHIEYKIKKGSLISSFIINDENDDYIKYKNALFPEYKESLYLEFCNLVYTKYSEWVNDKVIQDINFKDMSCFAQLKDIFSKLYESEHRETLINEIKVFEMIDI